MHIYRAYSVDIKVAQPVYVDGEAFENAVEIKLFAVHNMHLGADVNSAGNIVAAVDCNKKELCKVASCAKELHLLADLHCGNAAGNSIVVTVDGTHKVIVLVLNGVGILRNLCAELFERFGQSG